MCYRLEGDRFFSKTLRDILLHYHEVTVGSYSYGPCLVPGILPRGTIVGSYCSFGGELQVFRRNHPDTTLSQHPFFYNAGLGFVENDTIQLDQENPLVIGSDVWIGSRVTILPGCKNIGDGAMIGAGSIITKDVPSYALVAGTPAKELKKRYSEDIEKLVQQSRWWEMPLPELLQAGNLLVDEMTVEGLRGFISKTGRLN
ncbi:MAG: CatB-related O-acetyltransferase [Sneathiella sp.]